MILTGQWYNVDELDGYECDATDLKWSEGKHGLNVTFKTELGSHQINASDGYDYDVSDAAVNETKLVFSWDDPEGIFHAYLRSIDGIHFKGLFGSPKPISGNQMTATRHSRKNGDTVLYLTWSSGETGYVSSAIVHLASKWE